MKNFSCLLFFAFCLIGLGNVAASGEGPSNLLPMYGNAEKPEAWKKADQDLIQAALDAGYSRESAAIKAVRRGWEFFAAGTHDDAMRRFNQAWLLDPNNGDAYHGFAVLTAVRNGSAVEVEMFFNMAISRDVGGLPYVDFGWFLITQQRYEEAKQRLNEAMDREEKVRNARANMSFLYYRIQDYSKACDWAISARENGDILETGYLEEMCRRS